MRYNFVLPSLVFASSVLSAYVPSEPWSTLTPKEPAPSGASTDYTHPFGIQIVTVSASASAAKRDVEQIGDGQVQANSKPVQTTAATVVQQIGDGQIQHQTTAAPVVQQIGDGQIQHQTVSGVVQQIGDGQIQHQTTVSGVVQQIGDGQVQHQTVSGVVQQIGDGQIQHQTTTLVTVVQQTSDGQVQHVTSTLTTVAAASQAGDGQVQNTATPDNDNAVLEACSTKNSLSMTIKGGELRDSKGRIGAIVANRQFQFDGPPPQAGSIYAGGWSVTKDGYLALGDSTEFYQCQSGDFYNLYDKNVAAQCGPVKLAVVDLVSC